MKRTRDEQWNKGSIKIQKIINKMAIIRSHLLIITLNINESKSPINVHRKAKFFFRFDTKSNQ